MGVIAGENNKKNMGRGMKDRLFPSPKTTVHLEWRFIPVYKIEVKK